MSLCCSQAATSMHQPQHRVQPRSGLVERQLCAGADGFLGQEGQTAKAQSQPARSMHSGSLMQVKDAKFAS
jgi:hypothetical protein